MKEKILKYLKTVFLCILIINFLSSLIDFSNNLDSYLHPSKLVKNPTDTELISNAKNIEKDLNSLADDFKESYGEDYPALGVLYYRSIINYFYEININNFLSELIISFALGNLIYFIFISNFKKYKLFIALFVVLFVTSFFLELTNILPLIANKKPISFDIDSIIVQMGNIAILYTISAIILIIAQKIYSSYIEIRYS